MFLNIIYVTVAILAQAASISQTARRTTQNLPRTSVKMEPTNDFDRRFWVMIFKGQAEEILEKLDEVNKTAVQNKTELSAAQSIVDITKDAFNESVIEFIKTQKAFPGSTSTNEAVKAVVSTLKKYQTATTIADALREKYNAINEEHRGLYERHNNAVKYLRTLEESRPS